MPQERVVQRYTEESIKIPNIKYQQILYMKFEGKSILPMLRNTFSYNHNQKHLQLIKNITQQHGQSSTFM